MSRLTPWLRWFFFIALCTTLALELVLRVAAPTVFDEGWVHPNEPGLFRFVNAMADVEVSFNQYGQRGPEVPLERSDVPRVVFLGDSTTWAEGVTDHQTFAALLGKRLGVESLNVSKPGAGVFHYRDYWRRNASHFAPDVVVIGFFMGNDMFSAVNPYALDAGPTRPDPAPMGWRAVLETRKRAARALVSRWRTHAIDLRDVWFGPPESRGRWSPLNPQQLGARAAAEGVTMQEVERRLEQVSPGLRARAAAYEVDPWLVSAAALHPNSLVESQQMTAPHVLKAWAEALKVLAEVVDEVKASGATPLLFMVPRATQVDARYHADFRDVGFEVPAEMATTDAPQRHLARWCDERGVAWVDPLSDLRAIHAADPDLRLWFRHDVHPNVAGNVALADALEPGLKAALQAPRDRSRAPSPR